jgi:hypothetical protein
MIDLTNKPDGATRFSNTCKHGWLKKDINGVAYFIDGTGWKYYDSNTAGLSCWVNADVFVCDDWSIYNNTMPLSELSDEQVGAIFRYGIENGVIEVMDDNGKWWDNLSLVGWHTALAYRAKQKSERELFIEAVNAALSNEALMADPYAEILFNAGFKAPKVGE